MPHTPPAILLDEHGYPTDEALDAIRHWSGTPQALVEDLLDPLFRPGAGVMVEAVTDEWSRTDQRVSLITGGWSGCETVIGVIEHSMLGLYWQSSHHGGLHVYDIPDADWVSPMLVRPERRLVLPEERIVLRALMTAMECKVDSDVGECPSCGSAPCGPHGTYWYCEQHDWYDEDNADGVCGYALMLTRAATTATDTAAHPTAATADTAATRA